MTNAKQEFIEHTSERPRVLCAEIIYGESWGNREQKHALRKDYSEQDFNDFLDKLNFDYDAGYGGQELFGTIWYEDGTWSERGEYDGSEWWEYRKTPEIPAHLIEVKP